MKRSDLNFLRALTVITTEANNSGFEADQQEATALANRLADAEPQTIVVGEIPTDRGTWLRLRLWKTE